MLYAGDVSVDKARNIAKNLFFERAGQFSDVKYEKINFSDKLIIKENESPLLYIFNLKNKKAFVIVSAEDNVYPVPCYSFESNYSEENQPPAFVDWMESYKQQIISVRENKLKSTSDIKSAWEKYSTKPEKSTKDFIEPLIQTAWDQDCFYNEHCPVDYSGACDRARVGSYYSSYGYLTANFGETTYNWNEMPDYITDQNFEIAQIGSHCGIAVEMMYGPNGSGAYSDDVRTALMDYFGYSPGITLEWREYYSNSDWEELLISELDNLRPMYNHGSGSGGHAFVCDGYQDDNHFHFNWGWGGLYNGYYYVSNLHPGTHYYSENQAVLINVNPPEPPVADFMANITTVLTGSGVSFTDLSEHTPMIWSWTFEGGNPSSSDIQNPENIVYDTPGIYNVELMVTNWNGSDTITKTAYITVTDDAIPVVDFEVNQTNVCLESTVIFTDLSLNSPDNWQWTFYPATVTFVNGTSANSQNPEVKFDEAEIYSVALEAANPNGSVELIKEELITAGGLPLPFTETFELGVFKNYWTIENPDNDITWDGYYKLSGNLPSRKAAWMNFYEYTDIGQRDRLITPPLNFTGYNTVEFSFTHAYAIYSSTRKDSVIISISTDCGTNWTRIFEAGDDFATHPPTTGDFVPSETSDWCNIGYGDDCHTLDLNAWAGSSDVRIMFESYNGHGNMMYIDDVVITGETGTGVFENPDNSNILVFPNPSNGLFNISFKEIKNPVNLYAYNNLGQVVYIEKIKTVDVQLDFTSFEKGIYYLKFSNNEISRIKKIVIK
jgi:PKD repeat protein